MKNETQNERRDFLKNSIKGTLAVGVGLSVLDSLASYGRAEDMDDVSMPGMAKPVKNEELFRKGVIGPAELSLITSQLAVEKATNANAKEFAGFELTEAIAVTTVLKELGTPVPPPDAVAVKTLYTLKAASGADFDKLYIKAQLANHEFLRDHAEDFLKNSLSKSDNMAEQQGQHLAQLALANFKEHVAICKRIFGELSA